MKTCSSCRKELPLSEFQQDRQKPDGLAYTCRRCRADQKLRNNYGITLAQYEEMLADQSGACAICGATEAGGPARVSRWAVDHDHVTGKVRGILCYSCNLALGKFQDSIELLRQAIKYLENA